MEAVNLQMAISLILVAGLHIGEEAVKGFRAFLNTRWFDGSQDCPVSRFKGLFIDKIGLFAVLAGSALLGALVDPRWILIGVGILATDALQHLLFSAKTRRYTPGFATTFLYLAFLLYFVLLGPLRNVGALDSSAWAALGVGAVFIPGNYVIAASKVRRGDCETVPG